MTGYGFCGPMTAMGTVFDAKSEGAAAVGYYPMYQSVIWRASVDLFLLWMIRR